MDKDTTVKTKAANNPTDLDLARDALAVAIMKFNKSHSAADREMIYQALSRVTELEDEYNQARMRQYQAVCEKQTPQRRKPWVSIFGR